jgi:hypothetical protein
MRKSLLKSRKAAMEMSVGTIVTIVLLVSVLILGIFLIARIRTLATGVIDMTNDAVTKEINKLFAEPKEVVIYPVGRVLEIKQGNSDQVGVVIANIIQGGTGTEKFAYIVELQDKGDCALTEDQIKAWIILGKEDSNIPIAPGKQIVGRVTFRIPDGTPLCKARFKVDVSIDGRAYGRENFDVQIK